MIAFRDLTEHRTNAEAAELEDVVSQQRLQDALRDVERSKDQLRGVVDATTDLLAALDPEYRLIAFNAAYAREIERIYGAKIAVGESMAEVLAVVPEDLRAALQSFARAIGGEQFVETREYGDVDRQRSYYESAYSPIRNAAGEVIGAVHIGRDVNERTRKDFRLAASESSLRTVNDELERIVKERTHELTVARDQAEASNRIKDVFLATMSHELRTPLNSIIGFSEIMLGGITGDLTEDQRTQLGIIHKSGQQLLGLISDVLDISKIEAGQVTLRPAPVALRDLLQEQCHVLEHQARERGLEIEFNLPDEPVTVVADAERVRQVLGNLVSNALKYTDHGRVGVHAEASRYARANHGLGFRHRHCARRYRQAVPALPAHCAAERPLARRDGARPGYFPSPRRGDGWCDRRTQRARPRQPVLVHVAARLIRRRGNARRYRARFSASALAGSRAPCPQSPRDGHWGCVRRCPGLRPAAPADRQRRGSRAWVR